MAWSIGPAGIVILHTLIIPIPPGPPPETKKTKEIKVGGKRDEKEDGIATLRLC